MGKRGTKPKPTALVLLNGNPGHLTNDEMEKRKKTEENAQFFEQNEIPKPPKWISKDKIAKEEWKRVAGLLTKMKILTKTDTTALEAYCKCWSRYRQAEEELDSLKSLYYYTDNGSWQVAPQTRLAHKYLLLAKQFMAEFGLTPSSRGSMQLPGQKDEVDPMEALMKKAGF